MLYLQTDHLVSASERLKLGVGLYSNVRKGLQVGVKGGNRFEGLDDSGLSILYHLLILLEFKLRESLLSLFPAYDPQVLITLLFD